MGNDLTKRPTVLGANILFLVIIVLFFTVGAFAQQKNLYLGILITEFGIIMISVLIYIFSQKMPVKEVMRFNSITWQQAILAILIAISGYGIVEFLSIIWVYVLDLIGDLMPSPIPPINSVGSYIKSLIVIAASAAICEELLFRGIVMRGYEVYGKKKAIIYSSILFAAMHADIQNLIGPLFLGIVIGYLVCITDSIFVGMIVHFTNNALALTLSYISTIVANLMGESIEATDSLAALPPSELLSTMLVWGVVAIVSLIFFVYFLKKFKLTLKDTNTECDSSVNEPKNTALPTFEQFIPLIIGLVFIAAEVAIQVMIMLGSMNLNGLL